MFAPCFAHDHPNNLDSSSGWATVTPNIEGLVVRANVKESFCGGGIITEHQIHDAGYVDLDVVLWLLNLLKVKDLKGILRELGLSTVGKKSCLVDRVVGFFKGEE